MLVGDKLIARKHSRPLVAYEGVIIEMKDDDLIVVEFKDDFIATFDNTTYYVEFQIPRAVFIRLHYALDVSIKRFGLNILTPIATSIRKSPMFDVMLNRNMELVKNGKELPWFNARLNDQQKKAVHRVLYGEFEMPYIINGPPGKQSRSKWKLLKVYILFGKFSKFVSA